MGSVENSTTHLKTLMVTMTYLTILSALAVISGAFAKVPGEMFKVETDKLSGGMVELDRIIPTFILDILGMSAWSDDDYATSCSYVVEGIDFYGNGTTYPISEIWSGCGWRCAWAFQKAWYMCRKERTCDEKVECLMKRTDGTSCSPCFCRWLCANIPNVCQCAFSVGYCQSALGEDRQEASFDISDW